MAIASLLAASRMFTKSNWPKSAYWALIATPIASISWLTSLILADHASRFAELLGEVVSPDSKTNLQLRVEAEYGATAGKMELAKLAKELGYDAIHDAVHEMARDEARHGKAFKGLLERYF